LSNLVALAPVHSSAFGGGVEEGCLSDIVKEEELNQENKDTACAQSASWTRITSPG
jgi:hypothetical protein